MHCCFPIPVACRTIGLQVLLLISVFSMQAQNNIQGLVADSIRIPLAGANVLLLRATDSSLVKGLFTNESGRYHFTNIPEGRYLITSTHTGYNQAYSEAFQVSANSHASEIATITLSPSVQQLGAVTVTAKKPLLEQRADRLIINVSNSITAAGNTALQVLERSPGVTVDRQNNTLSLNGKNGVIVMINGKISRIPVSAVVQLLSGMSAGNIEKIEIITTPPANFDAEGNSGYINIVMKENDNYGTNGSVSVTAGYSKGIISQNNVNINHREGKLNLYGDFSYSLVESPFTITSNSRINNKSDLTENQFFMDRYNAQSNVNGRLGMDLQLSKQTILGILVSGFNNHFTQDENNQNQKFLNGKLDTIMKLSNNEVNNWANVSSNINLQHTYKGGNKILFNLDYIWYKNNQPVNYSTDYYNGNGSFLYNTKYKSNKITPAHFWVGALDFTNRLSPKIVMEAGVKATVSQFDNDVTFDRLTNGIYVRDSSLSAIYTLKENYPAIYTAFDIELGKSTNAKVGLRYEYTNSNLGTTTQQDIVDKHYGGFFPSIGINHKINEKNGLNLSYSRRITRPTFNDLAPFTYYADPNTLITGNPALQPSFTNTFKLDYTLSKYFLSVSYSIDDNPIAGFQPTIDSVSGKLILSAQNMISQKTMSIVFSLPLTLTPWWSMQYNFSGAWQQSNALYQKSPVQLERWNFQFNGNMNFTLPKSYSIEISGFYSSKRLEGIYTILPYGSLDIGARKKLAGKGGTFVLNFVNILNTMKFGAYTNIPEKNLNNDLTVRFSQPAVKLTYLRNFGKEKLKQKRDRATGAEAEKERVQQQ